MSAPDAGGPPRKKWGHTAVRPAALEVSEQQQSSDNNEQHQAQSQFSSRRRFLIWACMAGFVGPERVTERILADLADEETRP